MKSSSRGANERIKTGISGLDTVLDGGLFPGSIYIVLGRPGSGKTTLGNQLAFAHAARRERAVYVTLLSESHATMLKNLRALSFFEPSVINDRLSYVGGYKALRQDGLRGLLELLRRVNP